MITIMNDIFYKVERVMKLGLMLCLMALMPQTILAVDEYYGTYGIGISWDHETWHERYYAEQGLDRTVAGFTGSGTQADPYRINTVWDLCRLEDLVNAGNSFVNTYFRLEHDLDLGGEGYNPAEDAPLWYPIGVNDSFQGNFDGGGHTIDYMRILIGDCDSNHQNDKYAYGLFGYSQGVVRNLKMTHAHIRIDQQQQYNHSKYLFAGLVCGYLWQELPEKQCYGAVYGCELQGRFSGNGYSLSVDYYFELGGVVGLLHNPASVYQCHVDLNTDVSHNAHIGGIAGAIKADGEMYPIENDTENSLSKPRAAYVFDCTAHVTGSVWSDSHAGGICGFNEYGNIVACATTGDLGDGSTLGGIVGLNYNTVIDCVSMMTLHGEEKTKLGGIIGFNDDSHGIDNYTTKDLNVFNCVYSGHLNGSNSPNAYGLVGAGKPITNALFLGTMEKNENCASLNPLWNSTDDVKAYSDANLYDGGGNYSAYKTFSKITSGQSSETEFTTKANYHRWWTNNRHGDDTEITIDDVWRYRQGFYPRLQVGSTNITNGTTDALLKLHDYVIELAAEKFGDDKAALTTPKLFPQYAWLASVPAFTHDGQWAYFLDTSMSLARREMTDEQSNVLSANYAVANYYPNDPALMSVADNTATPKVNVGGDVWLTITSPDGASKKLLLNVNGQRKWDGELAANFDGGNGTSDSPYLIHDARQLILAFSVNQKDQYYKLVGDIWLNENLLTNTGEPSENCSKWDHESKRDSLHWKAHLDGDSHLIRGLFSTNAFGLVETMESGASIDNTGFVDCLVWSPESEAMGEGTTDRPLAFLTPSVATGVKIRNCLFDGVLYERRLIGLPNMGGLLHNAERQNTPYVEDCVIAISSRVKNNYFSPSYALFVAASNGYMEFPDFARRVLVLNNTLAFERLKPEHATVTHCNYPQGYLGTSKYNPYDPDGKTVDEMTDGTFFTGDGFDKWMVKQGRFPMLKSFAETAYGKLIALPVYTDKGNRFDNMNYLFDFTPGTATWQTTDDTVLDIDTDIRVIEPKTANSSVYLVRSLDEAKVITPIKTAESITAGIKFDDPEAKAFCVAHYDDNKDGEVSLAELKGVELAEFQADMNEDDGDSDDNDGEKIELFPEFRYFAGITDLGTSFHDKDKLKSLEFSNKITELSDDDFKGNTSMTSFTIPGSVTSVSGQAFYNSGLENYAVESDHTAFAAVDGLLMNKGKDQLLSFPSGRKGTSITIPDNVKSIASNAIYKMSALEQVYVDATDYDYETVVELSDNAFTAADGKTITYYIEDATQDFADADDEEEDDPDNARTFAPSRRANDDKPKTTDGKGKGHLLAKYQESDFWSGKTIERFFSLEVSERSLDGEGNYWATMYIGFDTELPEGLTAYIVDKQKTKESESTLVLREISNKVRMLTPIVIRATKAGTYKLYPSNESTRYHMYSMSENMLEGVNRNGLQVNQSDANDGGCLTLGKNKSGQVGFFIYKGTAKIPAFRAYLTVNKVGNAAARTFSFANDETTGIKNGQRFSSNGQSESWYNIQGQRVSQPSEGIYIKNGRKYVIK